MRITGFIWLEEVLENSRRSTTSTSMRLSKSSNHAQSSDSSKRVTENKFFSGTGATIGRKPDLKAGRLYYGPGAVS